VFSEPALYQRLGELRGEIMKSFMTFAGTLCLTVVWVLVLPEASALALPPQVPKPGSSLTAPIMLAVVVPPAELSLNQRTK
jgi:hypothetical protein